MGKGLVQMLDTFVPLGRHLQPERQALFADHGVDEHDDGALINRRFLFIL
jgi:hypothetical protein